MKPRPISFQGSTRIDRHAAIRALEDGIAGLEGWILDFRPFSNIAVATQLEVPVGRLPELPAVIEAAGIRLAAWADDTLDTGSRTEGEVVVQLHITFVHNEADKKDVVPKVPG